MLEDKYGQCRCHTSFPESISKMTWWIKNLHVTGPQGVPYVKVASNSSSNIFILRLRFFVSRQYLKNGLMDSIQICHVVVTSFQGVPYFKVTLNSRVFKSYLLHFLFFIVYSENNLRNVIKKQ